MDKIIKTATNYLGGPDQTETFNTTHILFEGMSDYISNQIALIDDNFRYFLEIIWKCFTTIHLSVDLLFYIPILLVVTIFINITIYNRYIIPYYKKLEGINDIALITCIFSIATIASSVLYIVDQVVITLIVNTIDIISFIPDMTDIAIEFAILIVGSVVLLYGIWNFNRYIDTQYPFIHYMRAILAISLFKQLFISIIIYLTEPQYRFVIATDQVYGLIVSILMLCIATYMKNTKLIQSITLLTYFVSLINPEMVSFALWSLLSVVVIRSLFITIENIYNNSSILYKRYLMNVDFGLVPISITKSIVALIMSLISYAFYMVNIKYQSNDVLESNRSGIIYQIENILHIHHIDIIIQTMIIWAISAVILWSIYSITDGVIETITEKYFLKRSAKYIKSISVFLRTLLVAFLSFIGLAIMLLSIGSYYILSVISFIIGAGIILSGRSFFENFVSSFITLSSNKILEGDVIEVLGRIGKIEDITLFAIHLRLPDGGLFIVPFNKVDQITNKSRTISISSSLCINLSIQSNIKPEMVEKITEEVNKELRKSTHQQYLSDLSSSGINVIEDSCHTFLICGTIISDYILQKRISRFLLSEFLNISNKYDINIVRINISFGPSFS